MNNGCCQWTKELLCCLSFWQKHKIVVGSGHSDEAWILNFTSPTRPMLPIFDFQNNMPLTIDWIKLWISNVKFRIRNRPSVKSYFQNLKVVKYVACGSYMTLHSLPTMSCLQSWVHRGYRPRTKLAPATPMSQSRWAKPNAGRRPSLATSIPSGMRSSTCEWSLLIWPLSDQIIPTKI